MTHGNEKKEKGHGEKKSGINLFWVGIILSILVTILSYLILPQVEEDTDKILHNIIMEDLKIEAMTPLQLVGFRAYNFLFGAEYDRQSLLWYANQWKENQGQMGRWAIEMGAFFAKWILIFFILFLIWESMRLIWAFGHWIHHHHFYKKWWVWGILVVGIILVWGLGFGWAGWPTVKTWVTAANHRWVWGLLGGLLASYVAWNLGHHHYKKWWFWAILVVMAILVWGLGFSWAGWSWFKANIWPSINQSWAWWLIGATIAALVVGNWGLHKKLWKFIPTNYKKPIFWVVLIGIGLGVLWYFHSQIWAGIVWFSQQSWAWAFGIGLLVAFLAYLGWKNRASLMPIFMQIWVWIWPHRWLILLLVGVAMAVIFLWNFLPSILKWLWWLIGRPLFWLLVTSLSLAYAVYRNPRATWAWLLIHWRGMALTIGFIAIFLIIRYKYEDVIILFFKNLLHL